MSSSDWGAFCLSRVYCEMTDRSVLRFERKTDSLACTMDWLYTGIATDIRIMIMLITIINSSRVNPRERRRLAMRANMRFDALPRTEPRQLLFVFALAELFTPRCIYQSLYFVPSSPVPVDFV